MPRFTSVFWEHLGFLYFFAFEMLDELLAKVKAKKFLHDYGLSFRFEPIEAVCDV